jgi:hypothetical protein
MKVRLHIYRKGHAGHVAPLGQIIRNQTQLLHTTACLEEEKANTSVIVFLFDHTEDYSYALPHWKRAC